MYGGGMYGSGYQQNIMEYSFDPDKVFEVIGASLDTAKDFLGRTIISICKESLAINFTE